MKKIILLSMFVLAIAVTAQAVALDPVNVRPVTINPAYPGEASLQSELDTMFGSGVVNAGSDQLGLGMFSVSNPGSNVIAPQFKFEWTSGEFSQTVGIFGWDGTKTVTYQIFSGAQTAGDFAIINWSSSAGGTILSFNSDLSIASSAAFSGVNRGFFGFYFETGGVKYYTVDSLNPGGEARVLGFMPNLSGVLFSYEDGNDFDYQDAGFFVESIAPVPEPATLVLLGSGLVGLAFLKRRKA